MLPRFYIQSKRWSQFWKGWRRSLFSGSGNRQDKRIQVTHGTIWPAGTVTGFGNDQKKFDLDILENKRNGFPAASFFEKGTSTILDFWHLLFTYCYCFFSYCYSDNLSQLFKWDWNGGEQAYLAASASHGFLSFMLHCWCVLNLEEMKWVKTARLCE